ncbi:serine/threonine protein kinase [Thermodesulfobacteriota bacterium]
MTSIKKINLDHLVGMEVGTATLLNEIARGGMAAVFLAYQRTLKRQIAVKILPKSILSPQAPGRFQQEAEASAILQHPNIVQIYEVGETSEFLFFTMQYIKGISLFDSIKNAKRHVLPSKRILPIKFSISIIIKVLDALEYAHEQGTIHRDIKPANILLEGEKKWPILTDFGLARVEGADNQGPETIRGTPIYMPPEQIMKKKDVDARADIYSTGTMLFEMLVSYLPFPKVASSKELLMKKLELRDALFQQRPSEINPDVDRELEEIVLKAISFERDKRFATSREFYGRLEDYLNSTPDL